MSSYEQGKIQKVDPYFHISVFPSNIGLPQDKRFLDGGLGALRRVLKAYMREVVWPHPPEAKRHGLHGLWPHVRPKLPSMVWIVVVLLRQCDDQHRIGLPWMEVQI